MAELNHVPKRIKAMSPSPYLCVNPEYKQSSELANSLREKWGLSEDFEEKSLKFSNFPFKHCLLKNLFTELETVDLLQEELSNLKLTRKNSDLLKFRQSYDLSKSDDSLIGSFLSSLKGQILHFISEITGFGLDSISLSFANYSFGDYLLCHDDRLENRKIAFIYYLTPENWREENGGTLDLFRSENFTPLEIAKSITPLRNSLIFFKVNRVSFHQVSEVLVENSRLSLSGWFHSKDKMELIPEITLPFPELCGLIQTDISNLEPWINPAYLDTKTQLGIRKKFESQSEIKLQDFILPEKFGEIFGALQLPEVEWEWRGVWDRERFQRIKCKSLPEVLDSFDTLLKSESFAILLSHLTGLKLCDQLIQLQELSSSESDTETGTNTSLCSSSSSNSNYSSHKIGFGTLGGLSRWSGGSYSLLNFTDPIVSQTNRLETILFLTSDTGGTGTNGFWSYVASGEEGELLRVEPENNCLCLVYMEKETGKFVKYLSKLSSLEYFAYSYLHFEKN